MNSEGFIDFIYDTSKKFGEEDMKEHIINKLPEFHDTLNGAAYDYFPLEDLIEWIKDL